MRRDLQCPRCGGRAIWLVRDLREHGLAHRPAELGAPHGADPFDAYLCRACGHAELYSRATRVRGADFSDEGPPCDECSSMRHVVIAPFEEQADQVTAVARRVRGRPTVPLKLRGPEGSFAVVLCLGCGRTRWFALGLSRVPPGDGVQAVPGRCRHCRSAALRRLEPVRETGRRPLPVLLDFWHETGHFAVEVCGSCGHVEWLARGIGELRADGRRVFLCDGATINPGTPEVGGPYR